MGNIAKINKCVPDFKKLETNIQIEILNHELSKLTKEALLAIRCRFWDCMTIEEIAGELGMTWDEADSLIESTLLTLRLTLTSNIFQSKQLAA